MYRETRYLLISYSYTSEAVCGDTPQGVYHPPTVAALQTGLIRPAERASLKARQKKNHTKLGMMVRHMQIMCYINYVSRGMLPRACKCCVIMVEVSKALRLG